MFINTVKEGQWWKLNNGQLCYVRSITFFAGRFTRRPIQVFVPGIKDRIDEADADIDGNITGHVHMVKHLPWCTDWICEGPCPINQEHIGQLVDVKVGSEWQGPYNLSEVRYNRNGVHYEVVDYGYCKMVRLTITKE